MLAIADLAGARLNESTAVAATLFLAVAGLVVGFLANRDRRALGCRSVAPSGGRWAAWRRATSTPRVPVDDASEVGLLEAGFNSMAAGLAERERLRDLFGRHVGRDVARARARGRPPARRRAARGGGALRGRGRLDQRLRRAGRPHEVVALLNAFFQLVVECVERHGGWVNKFEGDAALCVFGAPNESATPRATRSRAARALQRAPAAELAGLDGRHRGVRRRRGGGQRRRASSASSTRSSAIP